jgi:site-specific DNA recombinase
MDGYRFDGKPVCANRPVRLDQLDAAVWADVCALLQTPDDLRREFERRLDGESKPGVSPVQAEQQIAAVERTISRLIDGYEDGLLEKGEFEPRLRHARQRVERLRQEVVQAADETARRAELRLVLGRLDLFAEQVRQGLDHADRDARREIIRALVKVVKIEPDQVRIVYRISPRPLAVGSAEKEVRQHCCNRLGSQDFGVDGIHDGARSGHPACQQARRPDVRKA